MGSKLAVMGERSVEARGKSRVERWGSPEFSTNFIVLAVEPVDGMWGVLALDGNNGNFLQRAAVDLASPQVALRRAEEIAYRIRSTAGPEGRLRVEVRSRPAGRGAGRRPAPGR